MCNATAAVMAVGMGASIYANERARTQRSEEMNRMMDAAKRTAPEAVPPPATQEDPIVDKEADKKRRLALLRSGISQNIKTSGQGVSAPAAVESPVIVGTKTKVGQ